MRSLPRPCYRSEHRADPLTLHIYLATLLQAAMEDLHRLNPDTAPDPARMHARFLGWVRPRLLITRARRLRHLYGI
ncbi:hypothetical protein ACQEVC_10490 [Plantactinospora sp. CA-294935]|uniref:hypothetical protein n=1 Tax=Plantactinospora sp. CA-294935 TaxID=3240012 RepID=UPI003D8E245D